MIDQNLFPPAIRFNAVMNQTPKSKFATQVIASARNPFPLTFITYPDSVDRIESRREKRYPVEIEAKFYLDVKELGPENWLDGTA